MAVQLGGVAAHIILIQQLRLVFRYHIAGNSRTGIAFIRLLYVGKLRMEICLVLQLLQILGGVDGLRIILTKSGAQPVYNFTLQIQRTIVLAGQGGVRHIVHRNQGTGIILAPGITLLFPDILPDNQSFIVQTHLIQGVCHIALHLEHNAYVIRVMGYQLLPGLALQPQGFLQVFFALTQIALDDRQQPLCLQGGQRILAEQGTPSRQNLFFQRQSGRIIPGKVQGHSPVMLSIE